MQAVISLSFGTGATSPVGFAFGSTQLAVSATTPQSSTFSFGTATATGGTRWVTPNTFNPASLGASAKRRAAKQIGRKK